MVQLPPARAEEIVGLDGACAATGKHDGHILERECRQECKQKRSRDYAGRGRRDVMPWQGGHETMAAMRIQRHPRPIHISLTTVSPNTIVK